MIKIESTLIKIENLRLRAIIGIFDWERDNKQDVVINVEAKVLADEALEKDLFEKTLDYKSLTKEIVNLVETSKFFLIEKMAYAILEITLSKDKVLHGKVSVDKPHALRFADSVSVCVEGVRSA